jgi:hypothetical protein
MSLYEIPAGRAAVEVLIESGKLVPDFWVRAESARRGSDSFSDEEKLDSQVARAVKFAMGVAGVELPEWASPTRDSPDYVWIDPDHFAQFQTAEPYYQPRHLYWAMVKSHSLGSKLLDDLTRQDLQDRKKLVNTSWSSWKRLVPHFSTDFAEMITEIENERGNNGNTFSKRYRIDSLVSGATLRDSAVYDFYKTQGEVGLKRMLHGIGEKAVLGIGAMLFSSGEHDDLAHTAEKLEEVLAAQFKK